MSKLLMSVTAALLCVLVFQSLAQAQSDVITIVFKSGQTLLISDRNAFDKIKNASANQVVEIRWGNDSYLVNMANVQLICSKDCRGEVTTPSSR